MKICQNELEKISKYLYLRFFNYKDIKLNELKIVIDDYLHLNANLSYYNVETKLKAIARIKVDEQIMIDFDGIVKYGFVNLDLNKLLKDICKDNRYVKVVDDMLVIENKYLKSLELKDGYMNLELK